MDNESDNGPFLKGSGDFSHPDSEPIDDVPRSFSFNLNPAFDDKMDEDCRYEAVIRLTVPNVSQMTESILSPQPVYIRNLPWKLMVMPRKNEKTEKSMGFFLQCNGETSSSGWSCSAVAELRLLSQKEGLENCSKSIRHTFYNEANDWGFGSFISWSELLDPARGFVKDDTIMVEAYVQADAPHGVDWDSKKYTGFVGLKNQGATCYMNSLLQTLFFTNKLRKAIYLMPTEMDDSSRSVAFALQRVFYELQFYDKPVATKKLTRSFGWETLDSFMQHDVQELSRVLLDNLESKMKGTSLEGTIQQLFEGKMLSFIRCKSINYQSSKTEAYYDIQLNVKGRRNIYESFRDYITLEILDGENKYQAGEFGLQEAEKGVIFTSFPPVLHLHLMRFQYDPIQDAFVKINDRFEFPEKLELDEFLQHSESTPAKFTLHAVLVHSGDNHGGHYVVFINPKGDGKWCKFDDDVVSRCSVKEATERNFGGLEDDPFVKPSTNAYMLVYIRDSMMGEILQPLMEKDIPEQLVERLRDERYLENIRKKEKNEAHLYQEVNVLTEDNFVGHQGNDLFDLDTANIKHFRIKKTATLRELLDILQDTMGYRDRQLRPWPFAHRTNRTWRPTCLDIDADMGKQVIDLAQHVNPWMIFLELVYPDSDVRLLPMFDHEHDVLLFFKHYDPKSKMMSYCGHAYLRITLRIRELIPILNDKAGFPPGTELLIFEELKPNMIEKIENFDHSLERALEELMDGDIIIFQKYEADLEKYELPTCRDYFRELHHKVDVQFLDKDKNNDAGVVITLSLWQNYDQMAQTVGEKIGEDPYRLQFYKVSSYHDSPGSSIKCNFDGTVKDLVVFTKPKKLFYQRLAMKISELENRLQMRCLFVSPSTKMEKDYILYPPKDGSVGDLLDEARKHIQEAAGVQKLRMVEILSSKIFGTPMENVRLDNLANQNGTKIFRIEEVPPDELVVAENEMLIPVAHFHKDPYSTFGSPFLLKVKHGEKYSAVKERVQRKLGISEKELEKFSFAVVSGGRASTIQLNNNEAIDLNSFLALGNAATVHTKPWLGLEHTNKTPKRSRLFYAEKAIKIPN